MPRGIPKAGYRVTKKTKSGSKPAARTQSVVQEPELPAESYEEAEARIKERFEIMGEMAEAAIAGDCRSLIVSGPGGLGKSHLVHKALEQLDESEFSIAKGFCKATGLYRLLYKNRHAGMVLCFDDCDSVLFDETSINFLKAACDTSDRRTISYGAEFDMFDEEEGENIPRSFDFHGSVIFISNIDWDAFVEKGHKLSPHLGAMISRSHYIDLGLKTKRDLLIRIKHVIEDGVLDDMNLTEEQKRDVVAFINNNADKLRELSVRIVIKVANIRKANSPRWDRIALVTCCRNLR